MMCRRFQNMIAVKALGERLLSPLGILACALFLLAGVGNAAAAEQDIGKVIALRGKATIDRSGVEFAAAFHSTVRASDLIKTAEGCRMKLLFDDDSVLTVGENSRLAIKAFTYSKEKAGDAIFNLMDGKIHAVSGKSRFEMQTPLAVVTARDSVIFFQVSSAKKQNQPDNVTTRNRLLPSLSAVRIVNR
jgi:hypothetical protein